MFNLKYENGKIHFNNCITYNCLRNSIQYLCKRKNKFFISFAKEEVVLAKLIVKDGILEVIDYRKDNYIEDQIDIIKQKISDKSIISNIYNIINTLNEEMFYGLQWIIYGNYFFDDISKLTTPMNESNYSQWYTANKLTYPIFSGCSYNFSSYTTSTTETNTSDLNAITDNTSQLNFSVLWYGYFNCNITGEWIFETKSDDSSFLWVNSDEKTPITSLDNLDTTNLYSCGITNDNTSIKNSQLGYTTLSTSLNFTKGKYYPIVIIAGNNGGGYTFSLKITDPNGISYTDECAYLLRNKISN